MISQRLFKSEVKGDVPAPRTPPTKKTAFVKNDITRRSPAGSPVMTRSINSSAISSPVTQQQQRRNRHALQLDTTPEARRNIKESGLPSAAINHGSTTRKQRQLQKLRDQKLADRKSSMEKKGYVRCNTRLSVSDISISRNSERSPTTPLCSERIVRRNSSMDSPTVDIRYKTRIPLAPRSSMSPRVHQIIASTPFSRKKQKVESNSVDKEEESTSSSYINDAVAGCQVYAIESETDDTIVELPFLKSESPNNNSNCEGSGHSSTKNMENDDISSLGMDDSESTRAGAIPYDSIVYKAQSEPSNNIMSLRARRDAKLNYFKNVMTIAKARNEDEKHQTAEERDESSVATENSPPSRVEESSVVRSNAKINSLVEALTVLKQQNLTKTATLTQKLDQLMGSL
jgi:hypothetical protein